MRVFSRYLELKAALDWLKGNMLPLPNTLAATGYTIVATRLVVLAWQIRRVGSARSLGVGLSASVLLLLSCAAHHLGHALDAGWTNAATSFCGVSSLFGALVVWHLENPLANAIKCTIDAATYDTLTSLYNRRSAEQRMLELEHSPHPTGIIFLDIDNFKSINDRYGHDGGDKILASTASTIVRQLRRLDIAARWGLGDEFLILLPGCPFREATRIAQQINQAVSADGNCTISAGVSVREKGQSFENVIQIADRALYQAKNGGRDRVASIAP